MHSTNTSNPVDFPSWEDMCPLEQAQCIYWDMHKDAYGVRPRCIDTSAWTLEDFEAEFKILGMAIADAEIQRKASEQKAEFDFEARVQTLIGAGAKDREMALRWTHEAEGSNGDNEYLCYLVGLPYGYFRTAA